MKRLRVLATIFVVTVAGLGIWVASTGMRTGGTGSARSDTPGTAYDYVVRDVVVQQMGPDGTLQYEMSAKEITQQPQSGQITAKELVMHRDPPGSPSDGPNRWTLRADQADLPEPGGAITLRGKVHGQGRLQNSRATVATVATEELTYNLQTQEVCTSKPVDITRGGFSFHSGDACMNIKSGVIKVDSKNHGTLDPG
jgi:LPS export ABC transporter protein LptC